MDNATPRRLGPNAGLIGRAGSRRQLQTPALVLDLDALARNIERMAAFCDGHGVALRPHAKTHKSVEIARRQIDAGALGICVATLGEAAVMADAGIAGLLITSPVVGTAKIARLIDLAGRTAGLTVVADHPDHVAALAAAAKAAGLDLAVAVALDVGTHRIGAASPEAAADLARRIDAAARLRFAGIHAYAGHLQHVADYAERRAGAAVVHDRIARLTALLAAAGLAPPMVSGGGTGTHELDAAGGPFTELQAGSYIFTDVEYDAVALRAGDPRPFAPALFVQTTVISASHPDFVVTDGGSKWFAMGGPLPVVAEGAPPTAAYSFLGDEHGRLAFAAAAESLAVGAVVTLLTPHCDPTVNLYDHVHVVQGDRLVDIWPVDARGAV